MPNTHIAPDHSLDMNVQRQAQDQISAFFRKRRFPKIMAMIDRILEENGQCRILDVGGRSEYWSPVLVDLKKRNVDITLVNIERTNTIDHDIFQFQQGDATNLHKIDDKTFDLVHQNSLIEHVGKWEDMQACATETRRTGHSYYVKTPYFWFPFEPHFRTPFFHWLPEGVRASLITRFRLGYFDRASNLSQAMENVQSAALLDGKQMQALFPDADISYERIAGLRKSLIATKT